MPCYVVHATTAPLNPDPLDLAQIVSGDCAVSTLPILDTEQLAVGVWQHTTGVSTDVEVDEIFIVLSGRATIAVKDGPDLDVGAGDVGVLEAGAETTWTVHEDLRKIYVIRG